MYLRLITVVTILSTGLFGIEAGAQVWEGTASYVYTYRFTATANHTYRVTTSELSWSGADPMVWVNAFETTGWNSNEHSGDVLAVSDDRSETERNVFVEVTPTSVKLLKVVLASAANGAQGAARLRIENITTGATILDKPGTRFGGLHITPAVLQAAGVRLEQGDYLFSGAGSGFSGGDYDITLHAFSQGVPICHGSCGKYAFVDDSCDLLPFSTLTAGFGSPEWGRIIIGTAATAALPHIRVFLSKPSGDFDGDKLSEAIEGGYHTCNSSTGPGFRTPAHDPSCLARGDCLDGVSNYIGVPGQSCEAFQHTISGPEYPRPASWSPRDTDNDGLTDLEEVWCSERCWDKLPERPYNSPGICLPDQLAGFCATGCRDNPATKFYSSIVLPAQAEKPDPTKYDIYLNSLTIGSDVPAENFALSQSKIAGLKAIYEKEGLECYNCTSTGSHCAQNPELCCQAPQDCPTDPRYMLRIHPLPQEDRSVGAFGALYFLNQKGGSGLGHELAKTYFLNGFDLKRKYTGTFHLAYLGPHLGTQTAGEHFSRSTYVYGKNLIPGALAHELGHGMGINHNGDLEYGGASNRSPFNYDSLMNTQLVGRLPTKIPIVVGTDPEPELPAPVESGLTDGLFEACYTGSCAPGLSCELREGLVGYHCFPMCSEKRFSRGAVTLPYEYSELPGSPHAISETAWSAMGTKIYACQNGAGTPTQVDIVNEGRVLCNGTTCNIDFDGDSAYLGGGDANRDGAVYPTIERAFNDWINILREGKTALSGMTETSYVAFASTFEDGFPTDLSFWTADSGVTVSPGIAFERDSDTSGHFWPPSPQDAGIAAHFTTATGLRYILVNSGKQFDALVPKMQLSGLTVRARFKLEECTSGQVQYMLSSGLYEIFATCLSSSEATLGYRLAAPSGGFLSGALQPGTTIHVGGGYWYYTALVVRSNKVHFVLLDKNHNAAELPLPNQCVVHPQLYVGASPVIHGPLIIGNSPYFLSGHSFSGWIDDVVIGSNGYLDFDADNDAYKDYCPQP